MFVPRQQTFPRPGVDRVPIDADGLGVGAELFVWKSVVVTNPEGTVHGHIGLARSATAECIDVVD